MHVSARFAMTDVLKACGSLNHFAEEMLDPSHCGMPLPLDEDERELLERGLALLRASLDNVASLILGNRQPVIDPTAAEQQTALHFV